MAETIRDYRDSYDFLVGNGNPPAARFQTLRVISDGHWNGTRVVDQGGNDLSLKRCTGIFWEMTPNAPTARVLLVFEGPAATVAGAGTERYGPRPEKNPLSAREQELMALVVRGYSNHAIGNTLSITENTVKAHLTRIYVKLQATDRVTAAVACVTRGLLPKGSATDTPG